MKPPLPALLIADDEVMIDDLLSGEKEITIREGDRDYREGPVIICNPDCAFVVRATIVSVRKCKLSEVTQEEWEADGFPTQESILDGMRVYYPELTWDSIVTIIRWKDVQGYWVDHPERYWDLWYA